MIKRVTLSGSEVKVEDLGGQNAAIKNLGGGTIYASAFPNITEDADNVIEIPAGGGEVLLNARGTVYVLGTGKVQLTGTDYAAPNFKLPSSSSGGGGEIINEGVYCGKLEMTGQPQQGTYFKAADYVCDTVKQRAKTASSLLAELTGWELQSDGYTVLANGVGFAITETYVYFVNSSGDKVGGADFRHNRFSENMQYNISVCKSGGVTAWGIGTSLERQLMFAYYDGSNGGEPAVIAAYSGSIYILHKGDETYTTFSTLYSYSMDAEYAEAHALCDLSRGIVLRDLYILSAANAVPQSGEPMIIGTGEFFAVINPSYSDIPVLAVKVRG